MKSHEGSTTSSLRAKRSYLGDCFASLREARSDVAAFVGIFLVSLMMCLAMVEARTPRAIEILDGVPIQHGGRVKPFQSFAQEVVLYITGKRNFGNVPPTELVWRPKRGFRGR